MKIMYVNTLGVWGGVATYLKPLISDQLRRGNQVSLVVGNEGELTDYVRVHFPKVKLIILSSMKRDVDIKGIFKSIFKFRRIVKTERPDVIHLNCIMAGIIGRLGSIFIDSKIIYNAHGWAFEPGTSKKFKYPAIIIEKVLSLLTDKIICVSNFEKEIAEKYHIFRNKNQAVVIKNASEDFRVSYPDEIKDDVFRISMAARFWNQKDQLSLIKGLEIFVNNYKKDKVILYLLGDGPNLKKCKKYVSENNLDDNVIFTGRVSNVDYYYSISDVVALITNYDAIAISLIEALSMGKPIIASDVCGVSENFDFKNLNGFCIRENDPHLIADSINEMFVNPDKIKKMGNNSRSLYLNDFTMDKNIQKHNELYLSVLNKN